MCCFITVMATCKHSSCDSSRQHLWMMCVVPRTALLIIVNAMAGSSYNWGSEYLAGCRLSHARSVHPVMDPVSLLVALPQVHSHCRQRGLHSKPRGSAIEGVVDIDLVLQP